MKQVPIIMPQMGQSVAEGEILSWLKQVGDRVESDEVILEIETDKTRVEVESPAAGTLASCLKQAGEVAAAGEVIGMIAAEEEAADDSLPATPFTRGERPHAGGDDQAVCVSSAPADPLTAPLPEIENRD